jgi:hypothetical protein
MERVNRLALVLAITLLLAACGAGSTPQTPTGASTPISAATAVPTATPELATGSNPPPPLPTARL